LGTQTGIVAFNTNYVTPSGITGPSAGDMTVTYRGIYRVTFSAFTESGAGLTEVKLRINGSTTVHRCYDNATAVGGVFKSLNPIIGIFDLLGTNTIGVQVISGSLYGSENCFLTIECLSFNL
jgi:hypothetical protein